MIMEFVQQNVLVIAIAALSGVALIWPFLRPSGAKGVSPNEATMLINREDAIIIDVREPDEFAAGHLPEARNVPAGKLKERLAELEKFKERAVIVCCASGSRAAGACSVLRAGGFSRLHNLAGGVDAWRAAGMPLRKGTR